MKPTPTGWPRMSASVYYDEPRAAIDWLRDALGFEVRLKVEGEDGSIHHSQLIFGDALVMVGSTTGKEPWQSTYRSPKSIDGAFTQALVLFVDDVDVHHARALAAGATIMRAPRTDDFGPEHWADRSYACLDLEGHLWWFLQRVRG
jgi:uncharacterized glyoxalase superfamily protein PhnB